MLYVRSCVLRVKNGSRNNWHIHHGAVADEAFAHLSLSVPVEGDSVNGNYKVYYKKLLSIIEALRKELNAPDIPIIIGGLGDFLGKEGFGKRCTEYNFINQELEKFAFEQDNCYFVTASGLTSNPDGIHIDAISQRKFGLRYFEAFSNKQHVLEPLINENELLNVNYARPHTKTENIYMISLDFALGKISYDEFQSQFMQISKG
ncbi:hypothetical protein CLMAG_39870 [Clostridium magnum DSM 2767]|uniref:Sialate O-acetylesterase domain-containing protein n=1 Tax=Clostridium magnum DSM 2767 TaxID=1121326 RepID=A0A161X7U4_9CLOT|nr:hypothetical protein CLMAG_39870 [Clostridium magnum DSM 2767]SHI14164.1 hypothetical protein SAMN02745944_02704 [Clostridium magnum DSM 2767]